MLSLAAMRLGAIRDLEEAKRISKISQGKPPMIIPINVEQTVYSWADDELGNPRIVSLLIENVELSYPGWYATGKYICPKSGEIKRATINDQVWTDIYFESPEEAICSKIERQKKHLIRIDKVKERETHKLQWLYGLQTAAEKHLLSFPSIL